MKAITFFLACANFSFLSNGYATAVEPEVNTLRTISVTGTAEVQTPPDNVVWWVNLIEKDKHLLAAKKRSDDRAKAVVALREKLGLGAGDIETGPISVYRQYERTPNGDEGEFKYFAVRRNITIHQRDLKRFDEFLDCIISVDEVEFGLRFESSRILKIRGDARLKALKTAKEKATAMADVVGAKIGKVLTVNEHGPVNTRAIEMTNSLERAGEFAPFADTATGTFAPGAINIQVTVHATFELE